MPPMASRFSFSPGRRGPGQSWFRVGEFDVTTTAFVVGLGVLSMFVWAAEGPTRDVSRQLWLTPRNSLTGSVLDGQIWRLLTWPLANEPTIWAVLVFAVFFMLGSQLEALLGRNRFAGLVVATTVVPAVAVTIAELALDAFGVSLGLRTVEVGILCAFAAQFPTARFWPGIPAPIIAAVIVGLDLLEAMGNRDEYNGILVIATALTAVLGLRALGFAEHLEWLPRVPLPAGWAADSRTRARPTRPASQRRRGNLSVVAGSPDDRRRDMEIDDLLDRVAENGFDSLSRSEQAKLRDHSKRMRREKE